MEVYRLKHLPTGLYYTPSRGSGNLSKKGKLYAGTKPSLSYCSTLRIVIKNYKDKIRGHHKIIVDYFGLDWSGWKFDKCVQTLPEHWEIELVSN